MKVTVLMFGLMISLTCFSQQGKEFRNIYLEAEYYLYSELDYESALSLYSILNKMEPANANIKYKLGICYLNIPGTKSQAIHFFEEASQETSPNYSFDYDEKSAPEDTEFYLGMSYHVNNQPDKAIEIYMDYLEKLDAERYQDIGFVNQQIAACVRAKKLQNNPEKYSMVKLNDQINRYPRSFYPAISGDGNHFVYTAKTGKGYSIFYCKRKDDGWSKPINVTGQLMTYEKGISSCLSYDGQKLFLSIQYQGQANIYESNQVNGRWTQAEKLNRNINTKYWESGCCISADGNSLYFSSNRKKGFGGLDIYKSELNEKGDWGPGINLGPGINTPLMEDSPMILPDNITLYFSSQGHYNMGGYDLFYSLLMNDRIWTEPVNLGYPLNTTDDDMHIAPVGAGEKAYYAKFNNDELPKQDIYLVDLKEGNEVVTDILLTGTVQLQDRIFELDSSFYVYIIDTAKTDTLKRAQVDPKTGEYSVTIPPGEYKVLLTGEGYDPVEKQIMVSENFNLPDLTITTRMIPAEITNGNYLAIRNLLFGFDNHSLNDEAKTELEKMVSIMNEYPLLEYEIIGHTDVVGSSTYNLQLSKRRAQAVFQYVTNRGISKNRLITKGVGEIAAVARNEVVEGNEDPDGRRLDRRVEIKIIGSDPDLTIKEESFIPDHLKREGDLNYTVIVLKIKAELPDDYFESFGIKELKYINKEQAEDGFLYTLGEFVQRREAISVLGKLFNVGFIEARIVDQHELSDLVISEGGPKKSPFGNSEAIEKVPIYTIQIGAYKGPPQPGIYDNIKDLRVTKGGDGLYRYSVGKYLGYIAAKEALTKFLSNGYQQAWVRPIDELK